MGVVYRAEDTQLKRTAALKFLPPELTHVPEVRERFMHEAQAAAALNHLNIVTIYGINEHENRIYIAMEHVEGETLKKRIDRGPLPLDEAVDITLQIAEGLKKRYTIEKDFPYYKERIIERQGQNLHLYNIESIWEKLSKK